MRRFIYRDFALSIAEDQEQNIAPLFTEANEKNEILEITPWKICDKKLDEIICGWRLWTRPREQGGVQPTQKNSKNDGFILN